MSENESFLDDETNDEEKNPLIDIQRRIDEMHDQPPTKNNMIDPNEDASPPEEIQKALIQYQIQAQVAEKQKQKFDPNVSFYGTHVVNSNTKRIDNLRHMGEFDSTRLARDIPYMREYATDIKIRTTSEYQMCRSNPEIGGFDRKMQYTNIRRDSMDVKQQQNITSGGKKKGGILSMFHMGGHKEES